jgi:hypothetical protein
MMPSGRSWQLLDLIGSLPLSAHRLEGIFARALRSHFLLHLLEGLHDGFGKRDGVDVVLRVLFEQRPKLLAGGLLLAEEKIRRTQVFPGFEANDGVRGSRGSANAAINTKTNPESAVRRITLGGFYGVSASLSSVKECSVGSPPARSCTTLLWAR